MNNVQQLINANKNRLYFAQYNENPKAYPDATAGEYLDERLREIGLKK